MNKAWMIAAAGLLLAPVGAMAQANNEPSPAANHGTNTTPPRSTSTSQTSRESVRQQMRDDLQKAGFTDVHVVPDSFLVRAKDKSGQPVMMLINPDSVTEVMATQASGPNAGNDETAGGTSGTFTQVQPGEDMSSKVVGLDVYNQSHQDIGTIKDIAYEGHRVRAYILGVGGFLGMGDRYVAVNPSALQITYDHNAKTWHAAMNATADQLKNAPQFTYSNHS